ncbi:12886_t:CDS:2 [Dentiscutata erythropus]|uniref:12886_t:CDS:1 n=1 Tax=Dentiscutata erythropus TaxID=1348616 RepID=A0A9N9I530_9GLOM|nr:12886_t:CDS:2 [Dentiscutata erythropus]
MHNNDEYKQSDAEVGDDECDNGDEKHNLSSSSKVVAYTPNKIVTPADAAAVLAASLAPPFKDNYINYDSSRSKREIENEITKLAAQLEGLKKKFEEQIRGKNRLIEELEYALKKREKNDKSKGGEIERLENQIEAQRKAIDAL